METKTKRILIGLILLAVITGLVVTAGCISGASVPHSCGECSDCLRPCPCPGGVHDCTGTGYCNRYCPG
jgi:hypothetical protein